MALLDREDFLTFVEDHLLLRASLDSRGVLTAACQSRDADGLPVEREAACRHRWAPGELSDLTDERGVSLAFHLGWTAMSRAGGDPRAEAAAAARTLRRLKNEVLQGYGSLSGTGALLYGARTPEGVDAVLGLLVRKAGAEAAGPFLAALALTVLPVLLDLRRVNGSGDSFRLTDAERLDRGLGVLEGILRRKDLEALCAARIEIRDPDSELRWFDGCLAGEILGSVALDAESLGLYNLPRLEEPTLERIRTVALDFFEITGGKSLEAARNLTADDEDLNLLERAGLDVEAVSWNDLCARRRAVRALETREDAETPLL
jgi:hypothetical protein